MRKVTQKKMVRIGEVAIRTAVDSCQREVARSRTECSLVCWERIVHGGRRVKTRWHLGAIQMERKH